MYEYLPSLSVVTITPSILAMDIMISAFAIGFVLSVSVPLIVQLLFGVNTFN